MSLREKGAQREKPSFEEQMRQAEEEAGVPPDTEVYGEFMEHPEPDDQGRIPASRPDPAAETVEIESDDGQPPEQEQIPLEEPEPEPEPEVDQQAELNKKLGQLLNDNAELRRQLEQQAAQPEPQQQYAPPLTDIGWFDEMADSDPSTAANWALQNGQTHLFDRAVRTWYEQDPVAAGRYERQLEQAMLLQNMQQAVAPQMQKAQELANRTELEGAMQAVAGRHDDFAEVMGTLTPESMQTIVQSGLPAAILEQGLQGSQEEKERVFETLYRWQKADMAGQLVQAAREAPARVSEEARDAKREAFVGSAATTTPDEVPETEQERMVRAWAEADRSIHKGWEGKASRGR